VKFTVALFILLSLGLHRLPIHAARYGDPSKSLEYNLIVACYDGDLAAVRQLVAAGADMNRILAKEGSLDLKVSFSVLGRRSLHFRVRQINRTRSRLRKPCSSTALISTSTTAMASRPSTHQS